MSGTHSGTQIEGCGPRRLGSSRGERALAQGIARGGVTRGRAQCSEPGEKSRSARRQKLTPTPAG